MWLDKNSSLTKHISIYFSSNFLIKIAGFVSFPIWTRIFSLGDYGILSLASAIQSLAVAISKCGLQHASLRFYAEFFNGKHEKPVSCYYSTILLSAVTLGAVLLTIGWLVLSFTRWNVVQPSLVRISLALTVAIYFEVLNSIFFSFFRAEERSKLYGLLSVIKRYCQVGASLCFVLLLDEGLPGYFYGLAVVECLFGVLLVILFFVQKKLIIWHFSWRLFRQFLSYGFPLTGFELTTVLLDSGDRYLIQYFLGSAAVGLYSAAYNIAGYAVSFVAEPLRLAVMPMFMRIWEKHGRLRTEEFLKSSLQFYYMIGIPLIFGLSYLGKELLTLLASEKYAEGASVLPIVIFALVLYRAFFIYGAGLYLKKKTILLMTINIFSAVSNVVLNFMLIPKIGIVGAALATLIAYGFQIALISYWSFRIVRLKLPFLNIVKYSIISTAMILILVNLEKILTLNTFAKISTGFMIYFAGLVIFDRAFRRNIVMFLRKNINMAT